MILILNKDEQVVAALTNNGSPDSCPYYNDFLKEQISTGVSTYEFYCPSNHDVANLIDNNGYVVRADLDGNQRMFQIAQVTDTHAQGTSGTGGDGSNKYVYAEDAALELLNDVVRPNAASYTNIDAETCLINLLAGQRWAVGKVDDTLNGLQTIDVSNYPTTLSALQTAAISYGGELSFRVELNGQGVTGRYVDLVKQRGTVTNKRFEYDKDIVSIAREVDMTTIATALIGIGNNNLDFTSVAWSVAKGDPADKPAGQDWIGDDDALQLYGHQGTHITRTFTANTDDANDLLQQTYNALQTQKQPTITYTLQVSLLERLAGIQHEKVRIGDTVYVIDNSFSPALLLQARVLELDTCFSDPMQDVCTLGNYVVMQSNISAELQQIQMTLLQKASNWDQAAVDAQQALQSAITVTVKSTNGLLFKNGDISTVLIATVMQSKSDVTSQLPASAFTWHKYDASGNEDMAWYTEMLGIGRSVAVTSSDINSKATFECDVDISSLTNS